jgi:murein DD-endopeptidase MepM/ murein hydrolase activator NlpD
MKNFKLTNYILLIILCLSVIHSFDIHHIKSAVEYDYYFIPTFLQKPINDNFFASIHIPNFVFPLKENTIHRISSDFGIRDQVIVGMGGEEGDFHRGIDIVPLSKNAKAIATTDGVVVLHYVPTGFLNGKYYKGHPVFGGLVVIQHTKHIYSVYGHLAKTNVYEGMKIKQGQEIGIIGNTGKSTGIHLHFEILFDPIGLISYLR